MEKMGFLAISIMIYPRTHELVYTYMIFILFNCDYSVLVFLLSFVYMKGGLKQNLYIPILTGSGCLLSHQFIHII